MANKDEKTKTLKFKMIKEEEKELWEALERLPHGQFSEETKTYWRKRLIKEEKK